MPDHLTIEQRHKNMSAIRGKDTKPEVLVRKYLWAHGFRYRLNHPRLPGKPDIVMRKYRTCIFVNGCFWHGHHVQMENGEWRMENGACAQQMENGEWRMENEAGAVKDSAIDISALKNSDCCKIPKTNTEFWVKKILRNKARDIEVQRKLAEMGWHSITIWECELKPKVKEQTLNSLAFTLNKIYLNDRTIHETTAYEVPEDTEYAMVAEE